MRSRRDFLLTRKLPRWDLSQMSTKPRNVKVSGLERPRLLQFWAAKRPNSISRVFAGWSDSENSRSLSRIASRMDLPRFSGEALAYCAACFSN